MARKMTVAQEEDHREALKRLGELLPVGTTVYTVLTHVARSGMMRVIRPIVMVNNKPVDLTWLLRRIDGGRRYKTSKTHEGIVMGGAGMDMGFALVYDIARLVYPDGHPCTGRDTESARTGGAPACPSNDHMNEWNALSHAFYEELEKRGIERVYDHYSDAGRAQHQELRIFADAKKADPNSGYGYHRNRKHSDGGYALRHKWL